MRERQSFNGTENGNPHYAVQCVRYASEHDALRIVSGEFEEIRTEIVRLFREGKRSIDIAEELDEQLPIPSEVSITTKSSVIRRVLQHIVSDEERKEMHAKKHAERMERTADTVGSGRDAWMEEQGMLVWNDEWNTFLLQLAENPEYQRSFNRLNHPKIAAAMNAQFTTNLFTAPITRRHVEYLRLMSRKSNGNGKTH